MCLTASAVAQLCMGAEPGKFEMFDNLDLSPYHIKRNQSNGLISVTAFVNVSYFQVFM